jgi:hypothetical protein
MQTAIVAVAADGLRLPCLGPRAAQSGGARPFLFVHTIPQKLLENLLHPTHAARLESTRGAMIQVQAIGVVWRTKFGRVVPECKLQKRRESGKVAHHS